MQGISLCPTTSFFLLFESPHGLSPFPAFSFSHSPANFILSSLHLQLFTIPCHGTLYLGKLRLSCKVRVAKLGPVAQWRTHFPLSQLPHTIYCFPSPENPHIHTLLCFLLPFPPTHHIFAHPSSTIFSIYLVYSPLFSTLGTPYFILFSSHFILRTTLWAGADWGGRTLWKGSSPSLRCFPPPPHKQGKERKRQPALCCFSHFRWVKCHFPWRVWAGHCILFSQLEMAVGCDICLMSMWKQSSMTFSCSRSTEISGSAH